MVSLSSVAERIGASVYRDGSFSMLGLASHAHVGMLGFAESAEVLSRLVASPGLASVIVSPEIASQVPDSLGVAVTAQPRRAFYVLHDWLATHTTFYGSTQKTRIAGTARVHPSAHVAPNDVWIGERAVVEPNATILAGAVLGDDVVIRSGAVIGAEGFQFADIDGVRRAVPHTGGVRLGPRVEVLSNCVIDRAVFGAFTEVAEDTKIDALVHIAHNARVGARCLIAGGATIAGSARVGDDVWIGPTACISSEVHVGDGAHVSIGAVVVRDVRPGMQVTGNFAIEHERFLRRGTR